MDQRSQRLAKNKTDLMPKNASCKRWDTPILFAHVCYKRLLQKERGSRAPTTDEAEDEIWVYTRVHG